MLTLAIDCSARFCAVALHRAADDAILAAESHDIGRGHAERLPAIVQSVMATAETGFDDIGRIGVTVGPGSFAGIRVGVAFARGLSLALAAPAVGIGSLEAIAIPAARRHGKTVMAALDARRGHVWTFAADASGKPVAEAAELTPQAAANLALDTGCALLGSGAQLLADLEAQLTSSIIGDIAAPAIEDVVRLAAATDPENNPPEPRYLREADAKPQTGFALPHEAALR